MQKSRHLLALLLCLVMMFSVAAPASVVLQASAATAGSTQTIKLNKTKAAVYNGKKLKLKVSGTKQTVKWYTTDQKIATVKNGVVTTKKAGTVKIAAKVAGQKLVCKVTVKPALVASTKEVTMTAGKAKKAVLTLYAADGDVACKIADPAIASYKFGDWNGKKIGLKLTGKKAGVTTATVTNSVTKDKVKIKITVKAKAQPAAKPLTASATAVSLAPGEVKTVTLTESPASQLALTTAQPDIVRCSWSGAWVNGASALTLTGLKEGKTTITVADTVSKQSVVLPVVVGCDHVFSDAYIVDQAATCTAAGKESTHCIICGAVGATREIPPVAHDYAEEYTIDVPSTCSKEGEQSRHCKVCGARTDIKPVEKAPHDYGVPTVTKEATCKEAGSQTSLCKICGAQNVETIPVKDHTLGAWTVEKAATCKEAGVEAATCSVCGSKVTREIPQKEHTLGAWTVEKAATCKEAGVEAAVCSVCNTKVTREIPTTTAHNYGDWTVTKAATCQETGVETATCSICGNKQTREIAKVGHSFGEWTTSGDQQVRTCTVCGYKETKAKEAQPGETFQNPLSGQNQETLDFQRFTIKPARKVKINLKNILTGDAANRLAKTESQHNAEAGNGFSWRFFFFDVTYVSSSSGANDVMKAYELIYTDTFFKSNGAAVQQKGLAHLTDRYVGKGITTELYPGVTAEIVFGLLMADDSGDILLRVPKNGNNENTWISMKAPELSSENTSVNNNSNNSTTLSTDIETNLNSLKNYLNTYGTTNGAGLKELSKTQKYYSQQLEVSLMYDYVKKEFRFLFKSSDSKYPVKSCWIDFSIPEKPVGDPVKIGMLYNQTSTGEPYLLNYDADVNLNIGEYKYGDALDFNWNSCQALSQTITKVLKVEDYYDMVSTELKTVFETSMALTDQMLYNTSLRMHLSHIGFTSFSL